MADNMVHAVPLATQVAWMQKHIAISRARFAKLQQLNKMYPDTAESELQVMHAILLTLEQAAGVIHEKHPPRTETFAEARARLAAHPPAPEPEVERY